MNMYVWALYSCPWLTNCIRGPHFALNLGLSQDSPHVCFTLSLEQTKIGTGIRGPVQVYGEREEPYGRHGMPKDAHQYM
jgi:hypothetical protein